MEGPRRIILGDQEALQIEIDSGVGAEARICHGRITVTFVVLNSKVLLKEILDGRATVYEMISLGSGLIEPILLGRCRFLDGMVTAISGKIAPCVTVNFTQTVNGYAEG